MPKRGCQSGRVAASDVDDAIQNVLEQSAFLEIMLRKTGQGLGIEVHEARQVMPDNDEILKSGMAFTIEWGLYNTHGLSVRTEKDIVATEVGAECLRDFTRTTVVVG